MRGNPDIIWAQDVKGYPVEFHRYPDRLGFLPEGFYVARPEDGDPIKSGHGDSPELAIADLLLKQAGRHS